MCQTVKPASRSVAGELNVKKTNGAGMLCLNSQSKHRAAHKGAEGAMETKYSIGANIYSDLLV